MDTTKIILNSLKAAASTIISTLRQKDDVRSKTELILTGNKN